MQVQPQGPGELDALRLRALDLQGIIARLEAERGVLQAQAVAKGELTQGVKSQLLQMERDLAGTRAQFDNLNQRIESQGIHIDLPGFTVQDPHPRSLLDRFSDDALAGMAFVILLSVLVPLSIALSRRLWRRPTVQPATTSPGQDEMITRLGRLEHAVDTIAIEIERVAEGQRFVTKVMAERPLQARAAVQVADANDPALGEAQPFLALGAGPIEPIRVAERQKVRQSITPH